VQQQDRQQRPLLTAAHHQDAIALEHLQWAQKPEFHGGLQRVSRRYLAASTGVYRCAP
jgi:hypothetical protein